MEVHGYRKLTSLLSTVSLHINIYGKGYCVFEMDYLCILLAVMCDISFCTNYPYGLSDLRIPAETSGPYMLLVRGGSRDFAE